MKKIRYILVLSMGAFLITSFASAAENPPQDKPAPAQAQAAPVSFDDDVSRIARADSEEAVIRIAEEAVAKHKTCEDFGRFADAVKRLSEDKPGFKYIDALYYVIAKSKMNELSCLTEKNDIESGRTYMAINEAYRNEATVYLDRALAVAKSKELMLDITFLKFLATKEEFRPQKAEAFLDEMADKISKYSNDSASNRRELSRMADEFINKGFSDYALKLKIVYAGKVDQKGAQEVLEDIKKDGDKSFGQGNMRLARSTYDVYLNAAQPYFAKDVMGAKIMEIAEKYFGAGKYREARKYYESYAADYQDSKVIDYCKYKIALCLYYEKDYPKAVSALEDFLSNYQNSVYFDQAFETLSRLYFCEFPKETALTGLQNIVSSYYRKNVGDLAYILIGLEYYADKEYNKALESLKKVDINSTYSYTADIIAADIKDIKKGSKPSYTFGSKDKYRMWEPLKPITVDIVPMEAGDASAWLKGAKKGEDKRLEITYTESGAPKISVKPGANIKFALATLADEDRFAEYLQDKEDLSRQPKKVKEESEKDLMALQWKSTGGKFVDERQTRDKIWQAPPEPGTYNIGVSADDLGLVRSPDKGIRKDPAKEITIVVNVEEATAQ